MCDNSVEYPSFVKHVIFIGNKNENIRYGLEIYLENDGYKEALVILKNPSKANESKGDKTICERVLETLNKLKYHKVIIANVIPYYATEIKEISDDDKVLDDMSIYEYNKEYIQRCINSSLDIFVGWGNTDAFEDSSFYQGKIKDIEDIIKQTCYCSAINEDGTPRHPLYSWTNKIKSLNDFKIYEKQDS